MIQKPSVDDLQKLVAPLGLVLKEAAALSDGRKTAEFNHLKAVSESLHALVWVLWTGKDCGMSMPTGHVEEAWQAAEFYANKVNTITPPHPTPPLLFPPDHIHAGRRCWWSTRTRIPTTWNGRVPSRTSTSPHYATT